MRLEAASGSPIRVERRREIGTRPRRQKSVTWSSCTLTSKDSSFPWVRVSSRETSSCSDRRNRTSRTRALARGFRWAEGEACLSCSWTHKRVRDRRRRWSLMSRTRIRVSGNEREPKYGRNSWTVWDENRNESKKRGMRDADRGSDDVAREERRKHEEEKEFGKSNTTRKHDPRQLNGQERIQHEMTHLLIRTGSRHCIKGRRREEDWRQSIEEEEPVAEINLYCMFMSDKKEGETLTFWWQENERQEMSSVSRGRGKRRENVYAECWWHDCVRSDLSLWSTSWNRTTNRTSFDEFDWARWERWRVNRGWSFRLVQCTVWKATGSSKESFSRCMERTKQCVAWLRKCGKGEDWLILCGHGSPNKQDFSWQGPRSVATAKRRTRR